MQNASTTPPPSLRIRVVMDPEGHIGHGKIELLENISACGSISAAGRAMGMSYMRAWTLVDEINRMCNHTVVEPHIGGRHGGGASLTPFGVSLVSRYREMERRIENAAREELLALWAEMDSRTIAEED
jgi:molybdate transport system regulatory protein